MAIITGTPTLAQVEGILRRDFFRSFLAETGLGAYGTATGGAVGSIIDTTKLQSSQYDSKDWVGGWARISYDAGGSAAAPEGEQSPITNYAPSTGTLTVNPNFTQAPAVGDLYEIWKNVNPSDAKDILDGILANDLYMPCWTMLTEVPDGDMEQNNTTDWTGVNATVTKQIAEPTMYGKRYLRVVATAGNGYATNTVNLRVEPGQAYHLSAIARASAAGTTAKLQAWDASNGVEISSKTSTYQFQNRIHFEFTTPSTCYLLSIRLVTVENGMTTEWDEVCCYPLDATDIRAPWWVKNRNQVLGVLRLNPADISSDVWDWNLMGEPDKRWYIQDRFTGQLRFQSRNGTIGGRPLFMLGLRNETAYLNDGTDKKYIDLGLMMSCFGYKIYSLLYQKNINNSVQANKMKEMRDTFYWNWRNAENAQSENLSRIFGETTTPDILVNDEWVRFSYGR